jgi:general secretion pathway protein I
MFRRRWHRTTPAREDGFSLIEAVVAFFILATAVVAALQLFGSGLRLVRRAGDQVGAVMLAAAKLAELGPEAPEEGTTEGEEGAYRWTRRVLLEPKLLPIDPASPEAARLRVAQVSVEVEWDRNRRVALTTLRAWRTSQ